MNLPTYNASDFSGPAQLAVRLTKFVEGYTDSVDGEPIQVPCWLKCGNSRHLVSRTEIQGIIKGLEIAYDMNEEKRRVEG